MRSTELLVRSFVGLFTTVLSISSGDKQWFDASCRRAYGVTLTSYHAWCRACSADQCDGNCLGSAAVLLLMFCIPLIHGCMLSVDNVCFVNLYILPKLSRSLMILRILAPSIT